ncbi:MAG: GNAT family N-acetyltransferase [Proteobacteria bacterium]|nr:GNAT family N-acetyltransferase [Pseudomonadota bacterium]
MTADLSSPLRFEGLARLDDQEIEQAAAIMESIWPDYVDLFRREMAVYRDHQDLFEPFFGVAKKEEAVVGFSLLMASMMSTTLLVITWVAVRPDHHSHGIGRQLIDLCLAEAKRRGKAVVLTTTMPEFYTKIGFKLLDHYPSDEPSRFPGPEEGKSFLLIRA